MKARTALTRSAMALLAIAMLGCAATILPPDRLNAPRPVYDNTGRFLCPYTLDGTVAEWVDKGLAARLGGSIGAYAGKEAGERAFKQIPIFGGWIGERAGDAAGRRIAIEICGGWDAVKSGSDMSFNSVEDLSIWMYVNHSGDTNYSEVFGLASEVYPELKYKYQKALAKSSKGR